MNRFGVFVFILGVSFNLFAKEQQDCTKLALDLKNMKTAQTQLLTSMVNKDLALARSLELQAENVQKNRVYSEKLVSSLKRSASNLRDHHKNESKIIDRYEKMTAQLLGQVILCLQGSDEIAKNAGSRNQATGLE